MDIVNKIDLIVFNYAETIFPSKNIACVVLSDMCEYFTVYCNFIV